MTLAEPAVSPAEAREPERAATRSVTACAFCRRRLADEYYFTCRRCDASYCYIHMSRHQPAPCARQVARRRRSQEKPGQDHPGREPAPLGRL